MKTHKTILLALLLMTMAGSCSKNEENPSEQPIPESEVPGEIRISGLSSSTGKKDELVSVQGEYLNVAPNSISIEVDGLEAEIVRIESEKIEFRVPARAFNGGISIEIEGKQFTFDDFAYIISEAMVSTVGEQAIADFAKLQGIARDANGDIYVSDQNTHRILKISEQGDIEIYAGSERGFADGSSAEAKFDTPKGLVFDSEGNLYVADAGNFRIRRISPNGNVVTVAGGTKGDQEGSEDDAQFAHPFGIAIDTEDNLYVTDWELHKVKKVTPDGYTTDLAGGVQGYADGLGYFAKLSHPAHLLLAEDGYLYMAEQGYSGGLSGIRKLTLAGDMETVVGSTETGREDGSLEQARFSLPIGVAFDAMANLYVADLGNFALRQLAPTFNVSTLAGTSIGSDDGIGMEAKFSSTMGQMVADGDFNLYVCDGNRIRKITLE